MEARKKMEIRRKKTEVMVEESIRKGPAQKNMNRGIEKV